MTSQEAEFQALKDAWELNPLQLDLFGSQIAGNEFFERLDRLREQGEKRLPALEIYHYAMLLGFQGKYRLEAPEKFAILSRVWVMKLSTCGAIRTSFHHFGQYLIKSNIRLRVKHHYGLFLR